MFIETLTAIAAFAFVSSISPGPNNLMLMASGANFGLRRSLAHLFGINLGFTFMIGLVGGGVMQMFEMLPVLYPILKVASVIYLLYLAWKIASNSAPIGQAKTSAKPFSFLQAAAFQWVNPKAWAMSLTAISVYAPDHSNTAVLVVAVSFGAINLPSIFVWVMMGQQLRRVLTNARRLRVFNLTMASLLVLSLLLLWRG